jgi:glucose dehydrogenase
LRMSARALVLLVIAGAAMPAAGGQWRTYAGGPHRLFFNSAHSPITAANVHGLQVKWSFRTGAIVTASPSVATLRVPGKGREQVAFIQSWDHTLYALRTRDGSLSSASAASSSSSASVSAREPSSGTCGV